MSTKTMMTLLATSTVAVSALAATITEPIVLNGPYDLVVTEGTELTSTATIGGTGDFHVKANAGYGIVFNNANTSVGDFYADGGIVSIMNPAALGTGTVYVNDETAGGSNRRQLHLYGDATVSNPFVLGTEATTGWQERFMARNGSSVFNGKFTVDGSKITGYDGTSRFRGGIEGASYVTIHPLQNDDGKYPGQVYVEDCPIRLGGDLQVQGPSFAARTAAFHLDVAGNEYAKLTMFNYALITCGADAAMNPSAALYAYTDGGTVDLNGTEQSVGSIVTGGAPNAPIRFINGNLEQKGALVLTQTSDIADGSLSLTGYFDFTKAGAGALGTSQSVSLEGTLTVSAGRLTLNGTPVRLLADTVRLTGGTLDLGGKIWRCRTFEYVSGAIVNGTLVSDRQVVSGSGDYAPGATVLGDIEVKGDVRIMSATAATRTRTTTAYALPEGTAAYFPFDAEDPDEFLKDFGPSNTRLLIAPNGSGSVMRSTDAIQGTAGALYLDGTTYLQSEAFPSELTAGKAPYTISFWVKPDAGCLPNASLFGYGLPASDDTSLRSVYFCYQDWGSGPFAIIDQGFYGADVATLRDDEKTPFNDGWHHFVGTYAGNDGTVRLYVDGVKKCDYPVGSVDIARQFLRVGKGTIADTPGLKGWIDELLVVNRVMSDDEIAALYADAPARTVQTVSPSVTVASGSLGSSLNGVVYTFDSEAGLLKDSSGNGATLQVVHGTVGEHAKFSSETAHASGGSLYLDGKTYLSLAGSFPSVIPIGHAAVSICIRFKADADCFNGAGLIGWGAGEVRHGNYTLNFNNWDAQQYYQRLFFSRYGADSMALLEGATFNDGNWHSAVVTYDGALAEGSIKMYIDGQLLTSDRMYNHPEVTGENFCIGAIPYNKWGPEYTYDFKGFIDDVAIYPYILTESQAQAYCNSAPSAEKPWKPADDAALEIAAGARVSLDGSDQRLSALKGAGTIDCAALTVTDEIETGTSVTGDLILADGIRAIIGSAATVASGAVTIGGTGTVVLPADIDLPYGVTLFDGASVIGGTYLADWVGDNLPKRSTIFKAYVEGDSVKGAATESGSLFLLR